MTTLAAIDVRNLTPVEPVHCRTLVARESLIKLGAFSVSSLRLGRFCFETIKADHLELLDVL